MLSVALPGCTLAGAGIGAGIDSMTPGPYEERQPAEFLRLERDERVVVLLRNGTRVAGRFRGTHGPSAVDLDRYLMVSTDRELASLKASDVSSIAVEVTGNGWRYGALIGLAADIAVVVVAGQFALHDLETKPFSDASGCFC